MRNYFLLAVLGLLSVVAQGQTTCNPNLLPTFTPNLNMALPQLTGCNWGTSINSDFLQIDGLLGGTSQIAAMSASSITGTKITGCTLNSARYVGDICASTWGNGDIGAQLNTAYASLPSTGGFLGELCSTGGTNYTYTTPMVGATVGKYFFAPAQATTDQSNNGCGLVYTPTTATNALRIDFGPSTGGGYTPTGGLDKIVLSNNGCVTNGGCGSSATGIMFGPTNGGGGEMFKIGSSKIDGFGVGINFNDANAAGWGTQIENFSAVHNTTGLLFSSYHENMHQFGGALAVNSVGVDCGTSGTDFSQFGVSNDSQTVGGIQGNCIYSGFGSHWENLGSSTMDFLHNFGNSAEIAGGFALNDTNSGSPATDMFDLNGALVSVHGLTVYSGSQTITNLFQNRNGGVVVGDFKTQSPNAITNLCFEMSQCYIIREVVSSTPNAFGALTWTGDQWTFQPTAASALGPIRFNDSSGTTRWALGNKDCSGSPSNDFVLCSTANNGFGQAQALRVSATTGAVSGKNIVIATSFTTTAATTDNVTVTGMTASGHCMLQPTNSAAAAGIASVFVSNKTTNQITVTHTSSANWNFDVMCTPN